MKIFAVRWCFSHFPSSAFALSQPQPSTPAPVTAQVSGARRNQAAMCKLSIGSLKFYDFPCRFVCVHTRLCACLHVCVCVIKKSKPTDKRVENCLATSATLVSLSLSLSCLCCAVSVAALKLRSSLKFRLASCLFIDTIKYIFLSHFSVAFVKVFNALLLLFIEYL